MRRAIWLIITLTLLGVGSGLWADIAQRDAARGYLEGSKAVREAVEQSELEAAAREQAYWHALWQHDEKWLTCLVSHHHTRAVSTAMRKLASALQYGWRDEALRALDELDDALGDVEKSDFLTMGNLL